MRLRMLSGPVVPKSAHPVIAAQHTCKPYLFPSAGPGEQLQRAYSPLSASRPSRDLKPNDEIRAHTRTETPPDMPPLNHQQLFRRTKGLSRVVALDGSCGMMGRLRDTLVDRLEICQTDTIPPGREQCAWSERGRGYLMNEAGIGSVHVQSPQHFPHTLLLGRTRQYDTSRVIVQPDETLVEDSVARGSLWMRHARTRRPSQYRPRRRRDLVLAACFLANAGHMVVQKGITEPGTRDMEQGSQSHGSR